MSACVGENGAKGPLKSEKTHTPSRMRKKKAELTQSFRYHPFWKLVSQMIFGVHLLSKSLAKSEVSVMKILQKHVNELDGILERTTEDFLIIRLDVRTRIQYLGLPLRNLDVFDEMLEDRNFRLSVVAYNDQIEHSIERFTLAITDSLKDLQKAKEALGALWFYFRKLTDEGCFKSESLKAFHQAMVDNMEGWIVALSKLRRRGTALQKALAQLGLATTEMQRRVGIASRKDVVRSPTLILEGSIPANYLSHSGRLLNRAARLQIETSQSNKDSLIENDRHQKNLFLAIHYRNQRGHQQLPSSFRAPLLQLKIELTPPPTNRSRARAFGAGS